MGNLGIRFGPLTRGCVHLCIDMQNLFADMTAWHTPWMSRVLPTVEQLADRHAARTIFTRFIPAETPSACGGSWRRYYAHWRGMTLDALPRGAVDLVPSLARLVPPAEIVDKRAYSPWHGTDLHARLRARNIDTLVITGAETDVCVLAAVLGAVDHGYRVVLAVDAVCSSSDRTHDALLTLYSERYGQQVEAALTEEILDTWSC